MSGAGRGTAFVAIRDLFSEKLITLCLVLSVTAVLAPIMVLASVKVGFIDRLRSDFINDPSFREIRPSEAVVRGDDFFTDLRSWPGVSYVMPSVALTPREVDMLLTIDGTLEKTEGRLMPSDATDPVYARLEGTPPLSDGVVLTADLAAEGKLVIGSAFDIAIDRVEGNARKRVTIPVTVAGILPSELMSRPTILADPAIDRDVESYRAGIAVPLRGWRGIDSEVRQAFAAIGVLARAPLSETVLSDLTIRLAAQSLDQTTPADLAGRLGLSAVSPDAAWPVAYVFGPGTRQFSGDDLKVASNVLANSDIRVFGFNPALAVAFSGVTFDLAGADPGLDNGLAALGAAWRPGPGASYGFNDAVALPPVAHDAWVAMGSPPEIEVQVRLPQGARTPDISLRLRVQGRAVGAAGMASPALLGMVMRGMVLPLAFDPNARTIVEQSSGYRGFRVVAADFNDVPGLADRFAAIGTPVVAKSTEILKLRRLERSLDVLVATIAGVALAGGAAILASSFFANVQRKRVDYATLRLIGMRKAEVFRIPILQALCIAALGFALSCVIYGVVARLLNGVIAVELGFDGQLSTLYPVHFVATAVGVMVGTCLASLWASREVTRIDPAQALRSS